MIAIAIPNSSVDSSRDKIMVRTNREKNSTPGAIELMEPRKIQRLKRKMSMEFDLNAASGQTALYATRSALTKIWLINKCLKRFRVSALVNVCLVVIGAMGRIQITLKPADLIISQ